MNRFVSRSGLCTKWRPDSGRFCAITLRGTGNILAIRYTSEEALEGGISSITSQCMGRVRPVSHGQMRAGSDSGQQPCNFLSRKVEALSRFKYSSNDPRRRLCRAACPPKKMSLFQRRQENDRFERSWKTKHLPGFAL